MIHGICLDHCSSRRNTNPRKTVNDIHSANELRRLYPSSLSKNVRTVMLEWTQTYGTGHNDSANRNDLRQMRKAIMDEASVAKKTAGR